MSVDLAWTVAKEIVSWAQQARAAARSKREQRYVRVVEHTGVLVAGLRRLNSQANTLLRPLAYFDAKAWSPERREQLATNLILFAHEDVVLPRMRASLVALPPTLDELQPIDAAAASTGEKLFSTVVPLFFREGENETAEDLLSRATPESRELFYAARNEELSEFFYDIEMRPRLGGLVDRLRAAATDEDTATVRELAVWFLTAHDDPRGAAGPGALAPYAEKTQSLFGELLAAQTRLFARCRRRTGCGPERSRAQQLTG